MYKKMTQFSLWVLGGVCGVVVLLVVLFFVTNIFLGEPRETKLVKAVYSGNIAKIEKVLNMGADINELSERLYTPLTEAVYHGENQEIVKFLLEKGAKVNKKNARGESSIFFACRRDNIEIIKILIDAGANVNEFLPDYTPLMEAAENNVHVVELLINNGAKVNLSSPLNGETALMRAVYFEKYDILEVLLKADAKVNIINKDGKTALDIIYEKLGKNKIISKRQEKIIKLLKKNGAKKAKELNSITAG